MKNKKQQHSFFSIFTQTVKGHPALSLLLIAAIFGSILAGIAPPLILEQVINRLTGQTPAVSLLPFAIWYFLLTALSGLFDAAKESLITIFGQKVTHNIRSAMSRKLSRLPADYFVKQDPGSVSSRFVNDVNALESLFASGVISMFADTCRMISILVVIFIKSLGLGILLVLVTPLLFWLTRTIQKRMLLAQSENRAAIARTSRQIPETISHLRTIRVLHREVYMEQRYDNAILQCFHAMERSNFYDAIYSPIIITVSSLLIAVLMVLSAQGGAFQSFFGMTVGSAVAVIAYVGKIFDPLESIGMEIQNIQSAAAGMKRIQEFLDEKEFVKTAAKTTHEKTAETFAAPAVNFSNLSFGYTSDQMILRQFSLTIQSGEMITLAGRTGAGKSALFKLLLGLYSPDQGEIRVFGIPVNAISEQEKRRIFGYVEQGFHPIPGTIRDQVSLRDPAVSEEQVVIALQRSGLLETVQKLEHGLDTPCSPNLFSQGQFQLLSIARAIVLDPQILLLDEITANLDSLMESQVLNSLKQASENRTVLSISHRLYEQSGERMGRLVTLTGEVEAPDQPSV